MQKRKLATMSQSRAPGRRSHRRSWRWLLLLALVAVGGSGAAAHPILPLILAFKVFGGAALMTKHTEAVASGVYRHAKRPGTCPERQAHLARLLPDALALSRFARDVYETPPNFKPASTLAQDLGDGRTAYYEAAGQRYAEARVEEKNKRIVVAFRGTRLTTGGDIYTDVMGFIGVQTAYYRWAANVVEQVVKRHPGVPVILTGHSLGGGLAVYAVMRNPGVTAMVFNPAGVSWVTWLTKSHAERARISAAITVVSTRNGDHIEPVTTLSLARRSILPGDVFILDTPAKGAYSLHSETTLIAALDRLQAKQVSALPCEDELGVLAR